MEKTNITTQHRCVSLRNGIEIWCEQDRLRDLESALLLGKGGVAKIGEDLINLADIVGIFSASTMDSVTRRKNGEWKCKNGKWHDKGTKCDCPREMTSAEIVAYSTGRKI
ncbi:MAG: hypothetical protein KGI72_05875 [Patescibacteria group bacterium]|nr:hypothetical protein [Patescibacteria group bacterium]